MHSLWVVVLLNSRQIEVFYTIYKEGSLTRAARRLNVSQPSVSNSLRYTEQKLGLKLFLRRGKRLIPTPEADILYRYAQEVNEQISQFNNVSRNLLNEQSGYINVGCTPSLGLRLMPSLIKAYLVQAPEAQINLVNLQSAELESQLLELTYDLVICFNPEASGPLQKQTLQKGKMQLMTPPGFHSTNANLNIKDLLSAPFVRIKNLKSSDTYESLDSYLNRKGLDLNWVVQTETIEVAKSLVAAGIGFALIDDFNVSRSDLPKGVGLYSVTPDITYEIGTLRNKEKPMSLAAQKFVQFVESRSEADLRRLMSSQNTAQ